MIQENGQSADKNELESAYLAGFVDADGCIGLHKQPTSKGNKKYNFVPSVSITTTCKKTFQFLDILLSKRQYGHHTVLRKVKKYNWKDRYQIECRGMKRCQKILDDIQKHLITKKEEALNVLKFIKLRQSHSKMIPYSKKELECVENVKLAKLTR